MAISKWRTSEDGQRLGGLIGPNAILQMLPVLDRLGGRERRAQMLARAGIFDIPDGTTMIPETHAARLHRQLRLEEPELAPHMAARAGANTADYILTHRIPKPAQLVLRYLPAKPSAQILSQAIAKHAWTFAGSGQFEVVDPWHFKIRNNPLIQGETSPVCLCDWHAAVFARLYQALVSRDCICQEVTCGAQGHGAACEFTLCRATPDG